MSPTIDTFKIAGAQFVDSLVRGISAAGASISYAVRWDPWVRAAKRRGRRRRMQRSRWRG